MVSTKFFIDIILLGTLCGLGVDTDSNRKDECFMGGKGCRCVGLKTLELHRNNSKLRKAGFVLRVSPTGKFKIINFTDFVYHLK